MRDNCVGAMTMKADYHVVLGENTTEPDEADSEVYTNGSDGSSVLTGCVVWVPQDRTFHRVIRLQLEKMGA